MDGLLSMGSTLSMSWGKKSNHKKSFSLWQLPISAPFLPVLTPCVNFAFGRAKKTLAQWCWNWFYPVQIYFDVFLWKYVLTSSIDVFWLEIRKETKKIKKKHGKPRKQSYIRETLNNKIKKRKQKKTILKKQSW